MTQALATPAWDELSTRLRPFVRRRVASDSDCDDVLQEVLLRMHRGLPRLEHADRLGAWMHRIARTTIVDHLRTRARHPVASAEAERADDGPLTTDSEADEVSRVVARFVALLVAHLPSPYREALTLTELEGRTQKEAAEMHGISLSGMKSRVQRGRTKLRQMLDELCEIAVDARGKIIACEPRLVDGALPCVCTPEASIKRA